MVQKKFDIKNLIIFSSLFIFLTAIWNISTTRDLLQNFDNNIFYFLNSAIGSFNGNLDYTISLLTHSKFDIVMFLIMIIPCLIPGLVFDKKSRHKYIFLLGVVLLVLLVLTGANWGFFNRLSPSLTLENFNTLPDFGFYTKTTSHDSFPSNHGIIIFTWMIFINLYSYRKSVKILAILTGFLLLCPRLIVGAHWLTDSLIGSLSTALIAIGIFCFTPLSYYITELGDKIYKMIFKN